MRIVAAIIVAVALAVAGYFWVVFAWSYSTGERVGWVQKLSKKGWICKTWEGELTMISMPGAVPEKFQFTVRDDAVADRINRAMGKRVALHYEEKVGLPPPARRDAVLRHPRDRSPGRSARTGQHGPGTCVASSALAQSGPAEELRSGQQRTQTCGDVRDRRECFAFRRDISASAESRPERGCCGIHRVRGRPPVGRKPLDATGGVRFGRGSALAPRARAGPPAASAASHDP